jgi:hypothetical protein
VNAALQHVLDAQLLPYLALCGRLTLVSEARIARDDKDTRKPREVIDQRVADTVAEVLLLRSPLRFVNGNTAIDEILGSG